MGEKINIEVEVIDWIGQSLKKLVSISDMRKLFIYSRDMIMVLINR